MAWNLEYDLSVFFHSAGFIKISHAITQVHPSQSKLVLWCDGLKIMIIE